MKKKKFVRVVGMNIFKQLFTIKRVPLGRWRNCGEYIDYQKFALKEIQKKERHMIKEKKIDPYVAHIPKQKEKNIQTKNNDENDYILPFIL